MTRPFRERFLDKICEWDGLFSLVFTANVVFLFLLGLTYYLSTPDEDAQVVSVLALGFILVSLAVTGTFLRVCSTREKAYVEAIED